MLLTINHRTHYDYDVPQKRFTQSLRATPSSFEGQKVLEWEIKAEGAKFGASFTDGAGDKITTLTLEGSVSEIDVIITGKVETHDTAGVLKKHKERISSLVYLRETKLTKLDDGLRALAGKAAGAGQSDSLALAHTLCNHVTDAIVYSSGSTHHDVTAAEALAAGKGVCQDHTHALIAMAHAHGFPARYVVGYLHSDASGESHEASHAWCEIYIAELGWVGFDATNRCCPDERYLRLGSGLDAHDAAPIRGVSFGLGEERMRVSVSVNDGQQ